MVDDVKCFWQFSALRTDTPNKRFNLKILVKFAMLFLNDHISHVQKCFVFFLDGDFVPHNPCWLWPLNGFEEHQPARESGSTKWSYVWGLHQKLWRRNRPWRFFINPVEDVKFLQSIYDDSRYPTIATTSNATTNSTVKQPNVLLIIF